MFQGTAVLNLSMQHRMEKSDKIAFHINEIKNAVMIDGLIIFHL